MARKYFLKFPLLAFCLLILVGSFLLASRSSLGHHQDYPLDKEPLPSTSKIIPLGSNELPPGSWLPLRQLLKNSPPSANCWVAGVIAVLSKGYSSPLGPGAKLRPPLQTTGPRSIQNADLQHLARKMRKVKLTNEIAMAMPDDMQVLLNLRGPRQSSQPGSDRLTKLSLLPYCFPVASPFSFRDSWWEWRSRGKRHRAVDIFAREGTEVYAITAGVIHTLATWKKAGITLLLQGRDGKVYGYMHLQGYAAGIVEGKAVRTGELIGYVGRTGVQYSSAHLHFQVYADYRLCTEELLNPYGFLVQLCHGIGVTDLYHHKFARIEDPEIRVNKIQVARIPGSAALKERGSQRSVKDPSILVLKNF